MNYRIGAAPAPDKMKAHNSATWARLVAVFESNGHGHASFEQLCNAAIGHHSGTKTDSNQSPEQMAAGFVKYAIKEGWLKSAPQSGPATATARASSARAAATSRRSTATTYLVPWYPKRFQWPDDVLARMLEEATCASRARGPRP